MCVRVVTPIVEANFHTCVRFFNGAVVEYFRKFIFEVAFLCFCVFELYYFCVVELMGRLCTWSGFSGCVYFHLLSDFFLL